MHVILSTCQFGFREHHSTPVALTKLVDKITDELVGTETGGGGRIPPIIYWGTVWALSPPPQKALDVQVKSLVSLPTVYKNYYK